VLTAAPLFDAGGLRLVLTVQAAVAVVVAAAVLLALRAPARFGDVTVTGSLGWLRGDRFMWRLAALVFVGMGTYNAVATFLQPVLKPFGEGAAAGPLLAIMTLAGIVGAATLAPAVAARDARRLMLTAALTVSAFAFFMLASVHAVVWAGVWLAIDGFVLLACLPVVLDWAEVHTGGARQGTAVGFLMLAGNLGGVLYILAAQAVIGSPYLVLGLLALTDLAALAFALKLPRAGTREASGPDAAGLLDLGSSTGDG
jgi:MFS transporter